MSNSGHLANNTEAELISNCGAVLGGTGSKYNAVSEDGGTVSFTAKQCVGGPPVDEVYERIGSAVTIDVSEPSKTDCESCNTTTGLAAATFGGASRNGARAFFTTSQELLPGQTGVNLYEYDRTAEPASVGHPDGKIGLVSSGATNPEVVGVVRISDDGSTVYFVAKGALTGENPEGHTPEAGADNLYVARQGNGGARHVAFVGTLLTPAEQSSLESEEATEAAAVAELAEAAGLKAFQEALAEGDNSPESVAAFFGAKSETERKLTGTFGPSGTLAVDTSVWRQSDRRPAQATADGDFLVFLSSAKLTADDTSKVPQLFEYNAAAEKLTRVSRSYDGAFHENGNAQFFAQAPSIPSPEFGPSDLPTADTFGRALSGDGAAVFFTSADELSPIAAMHTTNVYEYRGGSVYLISGGQDASEVEAAPTVKLFGTTPSGSDVFFTTGDPLVPQASDSAMDLYDARTDGGFAGPTNTTGCAGEVCRGASGGTPEFATPSSTDQMGGDNATQAGGSSAGKPSDRAQRLRAALVKCRRLHRRHGPRKRCEAAARHRFGVAASRKIHKRRYGSRPAEPTTKGR